MDERDRHDAGAKDPFDWWNPFDDQASTDGVGAIDLLLLVDVSGSMTKWRIGAVNHALKAAVEALRQRGESGVALRIGVMTFAEQAKWLTPAPVPMQDCIPETLKAARRLTSYGKAFDKLAKRLNEERKQGEQPARVILLITDGEPTDLEEYPAALARLEKNEDFACAVRYAVTVGAEEETTDTASLLARFAGDACRVHRIHDSEALSTLIQQAAVWDETPPRKRGEDGRDADFNFMFR